MVDKLLSFAGECLVAAFAMVIIGAALMVIVGIPIVVVGQIIETWRDVKKEHGRA